MLVLIVLIMSSLRTTLTSLQYLDLQNCSSITSVKLPANVTLRDYGLA